MSKAHGARAAALAALIALWAARVDAGVVAVGKLQSCVNDGTVSGVLRTLGPGAPRALKLDPSLRRRRHQQASAAPRRSW